MIILQFLMNLYWNVYMLIQVPSVQQSPLASTIEGRNDKSM